MDIRLNTLATVDTIREIGFFSYRNSMNFPQVIEEVGITIYIGYTVKKDTIVFIIP